MAPHEKALFAIFGFQYFLDDRKAALKLMDTLNLSCRIKSKRDSGKFCTPVYSLAKSAFKRVIKSDGAQQWLKQHRYVRSGLVWLYAHDLRLAPQLDLAERRGQNALLCITPRQYHERIY